VKPGGLPGRKFNEFLRGLRIENSSSLLGNSDIGFAGV